MLNRPFGLPRQYYPIKKISTIERIGSYKRTERWLCIKIDKEKASTDKKVIVELQINEMEVFSKESKC